MALPPKNLSMYVHTSKSGHCCLRLSLNLAAVIFDFTVHKSQHVFI